MSSNFYLKRNLSSGDKTYTEKDLLAASSFFVILAEPGGGKTELLNSFAIQLGTVAITANVFRHVGTGATNCPLVIDAFDELAKVDQTGIHRLLANAKKVNPTHVIISSRSSEWDNSATKTFEEFLGHQPLIVRLCEFNQIEQREIFEHYAKGEDFGEFQAEVARFDLENLLPNPQFLKMFAGAYIESQRNFTDRRSIFIKAVEGLAKEANKNISRTNLTLSSSQKVAISSEVFAKLLLSGAEGVCTVEATENRMYPFLASLFCDTITVYGILATRLFKPGEDADQHRPVHKIVAEYCAAVYITKRIADPTDPLTLPKCLPIIAPNSTVRDELRGLLGWMATLGNKSIQETIIELDPYAVLANGDPSQLALPSKRMLVIKLKEIEEKDPYFRRGDSWRRFSVPGFFTPDLSEDIKPLLATGNDGHLRGLIIELLAGSNAINQFRDELRQLTTEPEEDRTTRLLAGRCLLELKNYDHLADLSALVSEASINSLEVAAKIIEAIGPETIEREYIERFFRTCANLYPKNERRLASSIANRYFITHLIGRLSLETIQWLLDVLTKGLSCNCGKKNYECDCRNGISKIVGKILDRYFELSMLTFDPIRIWEWVRNLNFHGSVSLKQSRAVQVLQGNKELRQGIISHVFRQLTDQDQIYEAKVHILGSHSHAGLHLHTDDYKFIVDMAFRDDNPKLWASFIVTHNYYRNEDERGPDSLRQHMRKQALEKSSLMREWAKLNRSFAKAQLKFKREDAKHRRWVRRYKREKNNARIENIEYIQNHRELIESGCHWGVLVKFANLVLENPDQIKQEAGELALVRTALRNCMDFISSEVPDLLELAELQCDSKGLHVEWILYAACLEILRSKGNLENVDLRILRALKTNLNMLYSAVSDAEREELNAEVDRLIFPDPASAEDFIRQYVEPQLECPECNNPEINLLKDEDAFIHLRASLSIEWLRRFKELAFGALDTLFEIAAQFGNRNDLKKIIEERSEKYISDYPTLTDNENIEQKRTFWFVRAFYFLNDDIESYWDWLKVDKNKVFLLSQRSGRMGHGETCWPKLSSRKVEAVLEAFIDKWPKVDLPSSWGSHSPKGEKAYRFLTEVIWLINSDDPGDAIPVLTRLLSDSRFIDLHNTLRSIHAEQVRKKALRDFKPPTPQEIVHLLDHDDVVTVEGLRQLLLQELVDFQKSIDGGEFNSADRFYEKKQRIGEVRAAEIIAERLNLRLELQGVSITIEHQLKDQNRCDITANKMISGKRRLLVIEAKGQWHEELYTAASSQLHDRYSIHPDAEQQGIYLVLWFGADEKVANRKNHTINSALQLKISIEEKLPPELKRLIDVFVLDVSK